MRSRLVLLHQIKSRYETTVIAAYPTMHLEQNKKFACRHATLTHGSPTLQLNTINMKDPGGEPGAMFHKDTL